MTFDCGLEERIQATARLNAFAPLRLCVSDLVFLTQRRKGAKKNLSLNPQSAFSRKFSFPDLN
jgi:hypothetical protein